jgi:hypothetical protein
LEDNLEMGVRGELYSTKVSTSKRTFFFNVKENRVGDLFLNIVESSRREGETDFARHQIMVYQEELIEFMHELQKAVAVVNKQTQIDNKEKNAAKAERAARPRGNFAGGKGGHQAASSDAGGRPAKIRVARKPRDESSGFAGKGEGRPGRTKREPRPEDLVPRSSPSPAGAKTVRVKKKAAPGDAATNASKPKKDGE